MWTWCASCSCRSGLRCIRLFPKHPCGQALSPSYFGTCYFGFEIPLDKIWLKCCWMERTPQTFHPSRLASAGFQSWYVLTCFGSTLQNQNLNLRRPTRNSRLATRNLQLATCNSQLALYLVPCYSNVISFRLFAKQGRIQDFWLGGSNL